jgi:hypothetical protein
MLNDDDDESEASDGHYNVGTIGELDAAPPRDPTCGLMDDGLDPATQLLLSNLAAATNGNDGASDNKSFPNVGAMGEPDAPPRNPTSKLIGDGFDLASQLLLSDCTDGVANGSNSDENNNNNSVIDDKCPLTKRQRSTSSCGNLTLDCDGHDELEDNYVFDVIATDNNEDARPPKRRRLPAVCCRYPSPASIVSKL